MLTAVSKPQYAATELYLLKLGAPQAQGTQKWLPRPKSGGDINNRTAQETAYGRVLPLHMCMVDLCRPLFVQLSFGIIVSKNDWSWECLSGYQLQQR